MNEAVPEQKNLWSRLTLEGLVIVISILLAFALDAAWDDRQERLRRDEYLRVLEDEFRSAGEEMAEQLLDHERQMADIGRLLDDLDQGRDFSTDAFRSLYGLYYFGPAHPVFTDLANTSSVDVLEYGSLRYSLFRYGRQKEFLENLHGRETVFFQQEMEPYLTRRFDYRFIGDDEMNAGVVNRIRPDEPGFHDDDLLRNLLIRRRGTIMSQVRVDRDIQAVIGEILEQIDASRRAGG